MTFASTRMLPGLKEVHRSIRANLGRTLVALLRLSELVPPKEKRRIKKRKKIGTIKLDSKMKSAGSKVESIFSN